MLLRKSFAVKVLDSQFANNDTVFARFRQEALISSSLGHPAIVQVVDFYQHEDGRPCMVMEYLRGKDLGDTLNERKSLPPEEVVQIVEQVAGALQAVHNRDIVHRDINPGNIFLAEAPEGEVRAKVLDFGISKIKHPGEGVSALTADQTILGTPHFMSPEQAMGQVGDVDWRTDIFALGTIAYYALSGQLPFNAPSLPGVLLQIAKSEPVSITELVSEMSDQVNLVLLKAMSKDKADRYQQVKQFSTEFSDALASGAGQAPGPDVGMDMQMTVVDLDPVIPHIEEEDRQASSSEPVDPEAPSEVGPEPAAKPVNEMTMVLPLDELVEADELAMAGVDAQTEESAAGSLADEDGAKDKKTVESKAIKVTAKDPEGEANPEDMKTVERAAGPADMKDPSDEGDKEHQKAAQMAFNTDDATEPMAEPGVDEMKTVEFSGGSAAAKELWSEIRTDDPKTVRLQGEQPDEDSHPSVALDTAPPAGLKDFPPQGASPAPGKAAFPVKKVAVVALLLVALVGAYLLLRDKGEVGAAKAEPPLATNKEPSREQSSVGSSPHEQRAPKGPTAAKETPQEKSKASPSETTPPSKKVKMPETPRSGAEEPPPAPRERVAPEPRRGSSTKPVASPPPGEMILLTLQVTPRSSRILLNGKQVSENPVKLPKSMNQYKLRIEAAGYKAYEDFLQANMSKTLKVNLRKITPKQKRPSRQAKTNRPGGAAKNESEGFSTLSEPKRKRKRKPKKKKTEEY